MTMVSGQPHYLITQRRDSYAYIDFLLGNYNPSCLQSLKELFSRMTSHERFRIVRFNFLVLWKDFLYNKPLNNNRQRYNLCFEKFVRIKDQIEEILRTTTASSTYPQWGFPKGRKQKGETIESAAYREFHEETMFDGAIKVYDRTPIAELYKGTDDKLYKTCYWIYEHENLNNMAPKPKYMYLENNIRSYSISDEVAAVKWVTLDTAKKYLPSRQIQILQSVEKTIEKNSERKLGTPTTPRDAGTCKAKPQFSSVQYWSEFQADKLLCTPPKELTIKT